MKLLLIRGIEIKLVSIMVFIGFLFAGLPVKLFSNENEYKGEINLYQSREYLLSKKDHWYKFKLSYEKGFLDVLKHTIQFGSNGTNFNYVSEGGQDVLFPYERYSAEVKIHNRHNLIFLIQPFDLNTRSLLSRDVTIDNLTFPEGTPLKCRYGFTFYRISYLYDFDGREDRETAIGLSFQIRNADIIFESIDGSLFRRNSNVGPVPILKFRGQYPLKNGLWIGTEIDGFYASGRYITGSENDFEGAILDASIRIGVSLNKCMGTFFNIRYIGGGSKGTEENAPGPGDGYTDNWIKASSISLGFYIK
jgi:hypothetical protein